MTEASPKTDPGYWDRYWRDWNTVKPGIDPRAGGLRNYVYRHLHNVITEAIAPAKREGARLIEIGCGGSRWLPYFASEHGYKVAGLDYSDVGVEASREILMQSGVEGDIVKGDLFDPPAELLGAFDVVFTNGLVEHFADTAGVIRACAAFARPGGLLFTLVPNMTGPLGALQRRADAAVYAVHTPLGPEALARHHEEAGLNVRWSRFVLAANFAMIALGPLERGALRMPTALAKLGLSTPFWLLESLGLYRPNAVTSPYVVCVADKPRT